MFDIRNGFVGIFNTHVPEAKAHFSREQVEVAWDGAGLGRGHPVGRGLFRIVFFLE